MTAISGTPNNDVLQGTLEDNLILAGNGNDTLLGEGGNDILLGGNSSAVEVGAASDRDLLQGGEGNDFLFGNEGFDTLFGEAGDDTIFAGKDNDIASGSIGNDFIFGDRGSDSLDGGEGNDTISGGTGTLTTNSGDGADFIQGGAGNDSLLGNLGNDTIDGGDGDDVIYGGQDNDLINGGNGNDLIVGDRANFSLSIGSGDAAGLDLVILQDLSGSFGDDLPVVRALLPDLVASIQSIEPNSRFGFSSFRNKPISLFSVDYVYRTDLPLTDNLSDLDATLASFSAAGGGGFGEAQLEALLQVSLRIDEVGFRNDAVRVVVLATDEPFNAAGARSNLRPNNGDTILDGSPPGSGEDFPSIAQVRDALNASNVIPIFAVTSAEIRTYTDLVDELGVGTVVQLSSDSSNLVDAVAQGLGAAVETVGGDTLTGGAGNDVFFFSDPNAGDTITDFQSGGDRIVVAATGFNLSVGAISASQFVTGSAALDSGDRFIYNTTSGNLLFDPDGNGATAARVLAILSGAPSLTENFGIQAPSFRTAFLVR